MYRVALISDILKTPRYSEIVHLNYHPADNYALFPNPASDFIDINLASIQSKAVKFSIFNSIGKQVLFEKMDNAPANKRLDLGQLESGQYFISIEPEGKRKVMKKLNIMR